MTEAAVLALAAAGVPTDERGLLAHLHDGFGNGALDLVVDHGDRHYAHLRTAFEVAFPRLRPGGRYELRGWGWAHGSDAPADRPAATNLLVELLLLAGTDGGIVRELIVDHDLAVAVRGDQALASPFRLAHAYRNRGIAFRPLL